MTKKKFFIIGKPVAHSLSPILHNYWFKKYNVNAEYLLKELDVNEIENLVKDVKKEKISGFNITLPYKQKSIFHLEKLVNDAKITGSVNTVYLDNQKNVVGENTDVYGFQSGYLKEILSNNKKNLKILLIGAGGVSPSIILALIKSNLKDIYLTNRTKEKALFLKKRFNNLKIIEWEFFMNKIQDFDIIINATSLGMKGEKDFEINFKNYKKSLIYIDTIYNPKDTKMVSYFKKNNIKTYNGLEMFIYQGQKSFYLWHKINPEIDNELIELLKSKLK